MNNLHIGDTPEQLNIGIMINGELWSGKRIAELQAQVEQLRSELEDSASAAVLYGNLVAATRIKALLYSTPDQCLAERDAEIKAQAYKEGFEACIDAAIDLKYIENGAYQCNQIRQQAKAGE